jgi:hypothetical protein
VEVAGASASSIEDEDKAIRYEIAKCLEGNLLETDKQLLLDDIRGLTSPKNAVIIMPADYDIIEFADGMAHELKINLKISPYISNKKRSRLKKFIRSVAIKGVRVIVLITQYNFKEDEDVLIILDNLGFSIDRRLTVEDGREIVTAICTKV